MHFKILVFVFVMATSQVVYGEVCDTCPDGFSPGTGQVTALYTGRSYVDSDVCGLVLCTTVTLTGTLGTDGFATYDGHVVPVSGTISSSDNSCCFFRAPSVVEITGSITAALDGTVFIDYWHTADGAAYTTLLLEGGTATCTTFTVNLSVGGFGSLATDDVSVHFSGGACESDTGPDPDPGDPTNPNDPTDPDPPDVPDGPDDPFPDTPDDPPNPDEPIIPDDPDEPDVPTDPTNPDDTDPILPDPPIDPDCPCCPAITARLDLLILWADYNTSVNQQQVQLMIQQKNQMERYMGDLIYGANFGESPSILQTNNMQNAQIIANQNTQILWAENHARWFERMDANLYDQTWYLDQLYQSQVPQDYIAPLTDDTFTPEDSRAAILALKGVHQTAAIEHNQLFELPDISVYSDSTSPTMYLDMGFSQSTLGLPIGDITVDFTPFETIRDMAQVAMLLFAGLGAVQMLWEELRKT